MPRTNPHSPFFWPHLIVSTTSGMIVSVPMSVAAMPGVLTYYFLPPVGQFTSVRSAELGGAFRLPCYSLPLSRVTLPPAPGSKPKMHLLTDGATSKKLYSFSRSLLESATVIQLLNRIPVQIVDKFEVGASALFLGDKQKVYRSGPVVPGLDTEHPEGCYGTAGARHRDVCE